MNSVTFHDAKEEEEKQKNYRLRVETALQKIAQKIAVNCKGKLVVEETKKEKYWCVCGAFIADSGYADHSYLAISQVTSRERLFMWMFPVTHHYKEELLAIYFDKSEKHFQANYISRKIKELIDPQDLEILSQVIGRPLRFEVVDTKEEIFFDQGEWQ